MLLETTTAESAEAEDLGNIHSAGKHLLRLVNEVLDLSKIEAGKMTLLAETVDVAEFMGEVVQGCQTAAARNNNTLGLKLDPELGSIECDGSKFRRVLVEMIDNAAKFTEGGQITVEVSRALSDKGEQILVRTRDTGCGIAAEVLPDLFERFSVGNDASSSKYGGTGLGLALNLELCRLMGGDISVESEPGVGSCFTVALPVSPPAKPLLSEIDDLAEGDFAAEAKAEDDDLITFGPLTQAA
jgi:signal transduction histidine kinase